MVLAVSCGASRPRDETRDDDAPCPEVARHLVALTILDNGLASTLAKAERMAEDPPEALEGAEAEFRNQCTRDAWSPDRRRCLRNAQTQEETLPCPER